MAMESLIGKISNHSVSFLDTFNLGFLATRINIISEPQ